MNTTFAIGVRPQRTMPLKVPPQAGHPTSTGTTVEWPSLVVVIQVFVVKSEPVISSVEKPIGGTVTVPVIGFITVVLLVD